ncbi:MAG: hypothetical protein AB8C84_01060 [Oligoflexales bacterium]
MSVVRKSQIVSLIVTKDREFKTRAVNFFNGVAFHAEKLSSEDLETAQLQVMGRKEIMNLVIDARSTELKPEDLFKECVALGKKKPGLMMLVYFPEESCEKMSFLEKSPDYLLFRDLPFDKVHYNDCFHGRGKGGGGFNNFMGAHQPLDAMAKKVEEKEESKKPNIIAFEASSHVRDTIQLLNSIKENSEDLQSFFDFGQRFNGITGAFAYLGDRPGWSQIRAMSVVIDEVCLAYTKHPEWKSLDEKHLNIIKSAAKNVYLILKTLREMTPLNDDVLKDCQKILEERKIMTEIPQKESQTQDEVDALLSTLT